MDMEEIRYLLGSTIFARAKAYLDRVEDLDCETSENGVRHLTADVRGGGRNRYRRQRHYEHRYDGRHHRCVLLPDDRPRKEAQEESAGDA